MSILRIIALFLAALVVRGADGETLATTDKKSCCLTTSSRGTLLAAATANPSAAGADGVKDSTRSAPNPSTKSWPPKPWPEGMVWIPGGEFWMGSDEADFGDAGPYMLWFGSGKAGQRVQALFPQLADPLPGKAPVTLLDEDRG